MDFKIIYKGIIEMTAEKFIDKHLVKIIEMLNSNEDVGFNDIQDFSIVLTKMGISHKVIDGVISLQYV
jgi:hypothetical protein